MKIVIIHGENSSASFNFLENRLKGLKNKGLVALRVSKESGLNITEALTSRSLFGGESVVVLEDPLRSSEKEIGWIRKNARDIPGEFIIYSESSLPLSFLKKFSPLAKVEEFRLPKSVFAFLESFVPGGSGRCLKLLHGQLEKEAPEFIFALLGKHVRDLYWVKVAPESLEYPTWRVSKLAKQAKAFSEEKLQKTLNSLAKIDFSAKTSSQDLSSLLDLLIVTQLQ